MTVGGQLEIAVTEIPRVDSAETPQVGGDPGEQRVAFVDLAQGARRRTHFVLGIQQTSGQQITANAH